MTRIINTALRSAHHGSTSMTQVYITSYRHENSDAKNVADYAELGHTLVSKFGDGYVRPCLGVYQGGHPEPSYQVILRGGSRLYAVLEYLNWLVVLAFHYAQDSVLVVDSEFRGFFIQTDASAVVEALHTSYLLTFDPSKSAGVWTPVKRKEALKSEGYTWFQQSDTYYTLVSSEGA